MLGRRPAWIDNNLIRAPEIICEVSRKMIEGHYYSIIGPPFSGKSRLLGQVQERIKNESPVFRCYNINFFNMLTLSKELSREDLFRQIVSGIRVSLGISSDPEQGIGKDPQQALLDICNTTNERLFLFLSNIDYLDDQLAKELLLSLRAISQESKRKKNITVAVGGARDLMEWTIGVASPFNIAIPYHVGPLSLEECRATIDEKKLKQGIKEKIDEETIDYLYQETRGNPYLVCTIADMIWKEKQKIDILSLDKTIKEYIEKAAHTQDIYMTSICRMIEENLSIFLCLLHVINKSFIEEPYDEKSLVLSGIFCKQEKNYEISSQILKRYLIRYLTPTRRGDLCLLHGRWDLAREAYSETVRDKRQKMLQLKTDRTLGRRNRLSDLIRAFSDILWREENPDKILEVFLSGLELFLNIKKVVLYEIGLDRKQLTPWVSWSIDQSRPLTILINPRSEAVICQAFYHKNLECSADCCRFASPIGRSRNGELRLIEIHTDYPENLHWEHRRYIVEEIASLALTANMAYENASHVKEIKLNLESKVAQLADVLDRQNVLNKFINYINRKASLQKKLYLLLTGLTIKNSLEFNRAMLFLLNEDTNELCGELAIGPVTHEDFIKTKDDPFFNNIEIAIEHLWQYFDRKPDSFVNNPLSVIIRSFCFKVDNSIDNALAQAIRARDYMTISCSDRNLSINDRFLRALKDTGQLADTMVIIPLITEEEDVGVICVDNRWDHRQIKDEYVGLARLFAAQAATIIQQERLTQRQREINERRRFMNMAAHELKTPVQTLWSLVHKVSQDGFQDADLRWLTNLTQRLSFLMQNFMDNVIIESGEPLDVIPMFLDLRKYLNEIEQTMERLCFESGHRLEFSSELSMREYFLDPRWVELVLTNLLENARHYSPERSTIKLIAREKNEDLLEFVVEDDGPGIPDKYVEGFMIRGEQIPNPPHKRPRMRLGLNIVRSILIRLNGMLKIENKSSGGLRVIVSLKAGGRR